MDGTDCSGHCCEDIGLDVSPEDMRASYMRWLESQGRECRGPEIGMNAERIKMRRDTTPLYQDIHLIYPMLRFLRQDTIHPDGGREVGRPIYHYTCNHYDAAKGRCGIYAIRPVMCSSFGANSSGCGYAACTWAEACEKGRKRVAEFDERVLSKEQSEEGKACHAFEG